MQGLYDKQSFLALMDEAVQELSGASMMAILNVSENALTRFANNGIHQNVSSFTCDLNVRVRKGGRIATANTNVLTSNGVRNAVKNALSALSFVPEDPELPEFTGSKDYPEKNTFCKATHEMTPDNRAEIVRNAIDLAKKQNLSCAGICENSTGTLIVWNTEGLYSEHTGTSVTFSITCESKDSTTGWAQAAVGL
jgi:predicted Zn-dependent protease